MISRTIDVVNNFNYLGIMLDANMSWKSHIAMVSNKLSRINKILHRLKYLYPQNILITPYRLRTTIVNTLTKWYHKDSFLESLSPLEYLSSQAH